MITLSENSNIRRIDELGRIVIPKDIRKKLHIKTNEPLEIMIESGEIRIKKYSELPDYIDFIKYLIDIGTRTTNNNYIITDRDHVVASTNKEYEASRISNMLEKFMIDGTNIKNEHINLIISDNIQITAYTTIYPLIIDDDKSGLIIEYNESSPINSDDVIKIFKKLIEKNFNSY